MRKPIKKKILIEPDYKFSSLLVAKFINKIMYDGKRSIAEKIVYEALEIAEKEIGKPTLEILDAALNNAGPQLELKSKRIGGANYQVPHEVRGERKFALAFRWIIGASRGQKGKPMKAKLAQEIINAYNNTGLAIKKKQDVHRMAEANKAFAHFAW
ncbi:MAG: 30S ribosomal protein S7 [Patescibacteria group bacterium]